MVVCEATRDEELAGALASPRFIVKRGRVSAEHERIVREPWTRSFPEPPT